MDLDYKDRTFSFKKQRRQLRRRKIILLSGTIIVLISLLIFFNNNDLNKIKKIESLILNNKVLEGEKILSDIKGSIFHRHEKSELSGIISLIKNDITEGKKIFEDSDKKASGINFKKILNYLSDNVLYKGLEIYSDFLYRRGEDVSLYRILSKTALFKSDESEKLLKQFKHIPRSDTEQKLLKKITSLNNKIKLGKIEFIFDRDGLPLAYFDLTLNRSVSLIRGVTFDEFDLLFKEGIKFFRLTIEKQLQKKLKKLFRNNHGSFIIINLEDGSIKGIYSKPFSRSEKNSVFSTLYEPGSIIKILTLFTYLNNPSNIFPFDCKGYTTYDRKIFYDWTKHGKVESYLKALAWSCNLVFSKMGISSGSGNIRKNLDKFLFNSNPLKDMIISFEMGKYKKSINGEMDIANLSIGLEAIKISTFHSAFLSSIVSQSGIAKKPYLIESAQNAINLGFYSNKPDVINIFPNNRHYEDIRIAMKMVIDDKRGTGRRSKVQFIETAIKTGTAGKKSLGFDSVITGFFPYQKPRFAFAFRLERGGKAELAGAKFLKKFLISLYNENPNEKTN
ncbi:MAG: penicillin-binding transpeptidase domain-containing protein [Acidobacteriota bacterium]